MEAEVPDFAEESRWIQQECENIAEERYSVRDNDGMFPSPSTIVGPQRPKRCEEVGRYADQQQGER